MRETFSLEDILKTKIEKLPDLPKVDYEYQAICLEMEEQFGRSKLLWTLPHRVGYTNQLMRYALKECKTRKVDNLHYFIAIIKNKIK